METDIEHPYDTSEESFCILEVLFSEDISDVVGQVNVTHMLIEGLLDKWHLKQSCGQRPHCSVE
jgi:hypothetical protein